MRHSCTTAGFACSSAASSTAQRGPAPAAHRHRRKCQQHRWRRRVQVSVSPRVLSKLVCHRNRGRRVGSTPACRTWNHRGPGGGREGSRRGATESDKRPTKTEVSQECPKRGWVGRVVHLSSPRSDLPLELVQLLLGVDVRLGGRGPGFGRRQVLPPAVTTRRTRTRRRQRLADANGGSGRRGGCECGCGASGVAGLGCCGCECAGRLQLPRVCPAGREKPEGRHDTREDRHASGQLHKAQHGRRGANAAKSASERAGGRKSSRSLEEMWRAKEITYRILKEPQIYYASYSIILQNHRARGIVPLEKEADEITLTMPTTICFQQFTERAVRSNAI